MSFSPKDILARTEMKKVLGGYGGYGSGSDSCSVKVYNANGTSAGIYTYTYTSSWDCPSQISDAGQKASNWVVNHPGGSANYDCACDGVGI